MRYRLRTLLIVVTLICMLLGIWPPYMRQLAYWHRQQSKSIALQISKRHSLNELEVEEAVFWRATDQFNRKRVMLAKQQNDGEPMLTAEIELWYYCDGTLPSAEESPEWEKAAYQQRAAMIYEEAAFRPWIFFRRLSSR